MPDLALRALAAARWKPGQMAPGDWRFNTHHLVYQFALPPHGTFVVLPPDFVEMRPAQLTRWIGRLQQARSLVQSALPPRRIIAGGLDADRR